MNTPTKRPSGISIGLWLFVALWGAIFLVAGVRSGVSSYGFVVRAIHTQGTVVRHDNRLSMGRGVRTSNESCRAVVSYQVGGESYEVFGPVQVQPDVDGWPKVYPVGTTVEVLYEPGRPGEALVESFSEQWAECMVFGGVGMVFMLLGIWQAWSRWRARRGNVLVKAAPNQTLHRMAAPRRQLTIRTIRRGRHR